MFKSFYRDDFLNQDVSKLKDVYNAYYHFVHPKIKKNLHEASEVHYENVAPPFLRYEDEHDGQHYVSKFGIRNNNNNDDDDDNDEGEDD